jgi:hypothetical protein
MWAKPKQDPKRDATKASLQTCKPASKLANPKQFNIGMRWNTCALSRAAFQYFIE